ncbi:MAG: ATP-dependent helicase [Deltaproteobacteria bacterium]|nr:ATP-dependent helicase [Deltaproteobacteria bacterium]
MAENAAPSPSSQTGLAGFSPAARNWFSSAFASPTPVQTAAWDAIRGGGSTLVIAPTGSGKTLAAFMHSIDRLFGEPGRGGPEHTDRPHAAGTRVLYISPLKALGADVRKNLRVPLRGIAAERKRRGDPDVTLTVGMRTGDTTASERASLVRRPPDILITTPESLYLMLTSKARETLRGVEMVIVDEIHAVAGTKRGAHLALSLERLDLLLPRPARRVGLSATVRPVERVAEFLGGTLPVTVVNPSPCKRLEMRIVVPVEDMTDLPAPSSGSAERAGRAGSIWFHVESAILEQVLAFRSTIVFVNSRGLAERLTARLNELYAERFGEAPVEEAEPLHYGSASGGTGARAVGLPPLIARSHHGSVSKERRTEIEQELKTGELRCVVATSSLELGIDMGTVDLVIQVGAPPSVSSGLQRVGRSGHQVGGTPSGLVYPRTRRDLVDATVTVENMLHGRLEAVVPLRNPLDILAQQTVAAVAMDPLHVDSWYGAVRRSDPFRSLPRAAFDATLDMLAGRFPSEAFAELRPRLVWDRNTGILTPRPGAQRLAVVNGGTIPDRGTFRVVLPEGEERAGARRVGELDEEMVYESRVNDVITLGTASWRIRQITNDQVVVVPAPGKSARLPFWHGEGPGRDAELGEAIGEFLRDMENALDAGPASDRLRAAGLDDNAAANLRRLLAEQRAATTALPTDKTLVVERCHDERGDWRLMLHSPYGRRVHAPWALAVADRIRQRFGVDASVVPSDDGIVARIPEAEGRLPGAELFVFDPQGLQRIVTGAVGTSALFTARFRECASRALLLTRRAPGRRSPLWQQRLRAGQLLEVAREYPDFPILIETARECLRDVYDLPALQRLMARVESGAIRFVDVTTETPSPFAANLLFGYVGEFMYGDDAPLAERRAALLSLDAGLLSDLLGQADFGELLDPAVVERIAAELQRTAPDRRAAGLEGVADLLRELGPLSPEEVAARLRPDSPGDETLPARAKEHLAALSAARRAIPVRIAGVERWAAVEDAARLRDGLGATLPGGIPDVFLEPAPDALLDLLTRYARTHGPFTTGQAASRFGLGAAVADDVLARLRDQGRLLPGDFSAASPLPPEHPPDGERRDGALGNHGWVWDEVFRRLRARSLQAAREAARPVGGDAYARQLLERQFLVEPSSSPAVPGCRAALQGADGVARVIEQLAGIPLPASLWESHILPSRVRDYASGMLDGLVAAGEALWAGRGRLGDHDGLAALHLREFAPETLPAFSDSGGETLTGLEQAVLAVLGDGGAYFARQIAEHALIRPALDRDTAFSTDPVTRTDLRDALWNLAWSGHITSDSWAALRGFTGPGSPRQAAKRRTVRRRFPGGAYRSYSFLSKTAVPGPADYDDPSLAGRWSIVPREPVPDTARALATAESLLDRYGVVTRGVAVAEKIPGGFPLLQRIFRGMEDAGRVLRGRFVDGLGAAQFADHATIDRLRELAGEDRRNAPAVALSAADPANPYGAALPWPVHPAGMKPSRHPGALVVIRGGRVVLWLSRGGRQLLTFIPESGPDAAGILHEATEALAAALARSGSGTFTIATADGLPVMATPTADALRAAGFSPTPNGLCWYGRPR